MPVTRGAVVGGLRGPRRLLRSPRPPVPPAAPSRTHEYRFRHRDSRRTARRSSTSPPTISPSRRTARTATSSRRSWRASRCRSPSSSTTTAPASSARASSASCSCSRAAPRCRSAASSGRRSRLVDYTTDAQKLVDAIVQLTARPGTPDGGQLLEGIFQAAREQEKREASRPVIVAVTVGGEEHSTLPAHHVLDQLAKSGSALYVISVANSALRQTRAIDKPSAAARREPESERGARRRSEAERRLAGSHRRRARNHPGAPADRGGAEEPVRARVLQAPQGQATRDAQRVGQASGVTLRAPTRGSVYDKRP